MYRVIMEPSEILKYQKILEYVIQFGAKKYENETIITHGNPQIVPKKHDVFWVPKYKFWSVSFCRIKDGNRYCNWFGSIEPQKGNLKIDVEINFTLTRRNTGAGRLITDNDNIYVAHNGEIRKNKDKFWKEYKGKFIEISKNKFAIIGKLPYKRIYSDMEKGKQPTEEIKKECILFQKQVKEFIAFVKKIKNDNDDGKNSNNSLNSTKAISTKHPLSDKPIEIRERIQGKILQINENCIGCYKDPIFIDSGTMGIWKNIGEICNNEKDFIVFSLDLYKILYETTRSKNNNFNKNKCKPFYDFRLPDEFLKRGSQTRHFMDIVGTLRHKYAHKEPEYKVHINKLEYPDILEELKIDKLPVVDYKKFQVEVLKLFDNSMDVLLKIQEEKLKHPKKP